MKVVKNNENKLLKRKEIEALLANKEAAMARHDIKTQLAKTLKAKEELIVVDKISNHFGSNDVLINAYVYDDVETLKKLTDSYMIKRNTAPVAEEGGEE